MRKKKEGEAVLFTNTSEVELVDLMGDDRRLVETATVSTGADSATWSDERVVGLINRLMKDRHGSAFEHVYFTFKIKTPLFTARQFMRHRMASYNEVSGRYRLLPQEYYIPPYDRPVMQIGKAMDYEFVVDEKIGAMANVAMRGACEHASKIYEQLLDAGVAREVARMIIPVNVMTEFFVTINLRSLFNLMSLRSTEQGLFPSHPQFEFSQVTALIEEIVATEMPCAYAAFVEHGRVQP